MYPVGSEGCRMHGTNIRTHVSYDFHQYNTESWFLPFDLVLFIFFLSLRCDSLLLFEKLQAIYIFPSPSPSMVFIIARNDIVFRAVKLTWTTFCCCYSWVRPVSCMHSKTVGYPYCILLEWQHVKCASIVVCVFHSMKNLYFNLDMYHSSYLKYFATSLLSTNTNAIYASIFICYCEIGYMVPSTILLLIVVDFFSLDFICDRKKGRWSHQIYI